MATADEEVRITLRLPASLRDRLTEAASDSGRSMNGEIVSRLEDSLDGEEKLWRVVGALEDKVEEVLKRLDDMEPEVKTMWSKFEGGYFGGGS